MITRKQRITWFNDVDNARFYMEDLRKMSNISDVKMVKSRYYTNDEGFKEQCYVSYMENIEE